MGLIRIIGLLVVLSQLGCAHHNPNPWPIFEVNIDSLRGDSSKDKRDFIIVSGKEAIETSDLQFKEFSRYVTNALENIQLGVLLFLPRYPRHAFKNFSSCGVCQIVCVTDYCVGILPSNRMAN
jgi:hypothetical protein